MKSTTTKYILLILLFIISGNRTIYANDKESGIKEFWQEAYLYTSFFEKLRGEILFNNLYSRDIGNYDWFLEGKLTYPVKSWLDLELLYRHEFVDINGIKEQEYRPMFRVSGKKQIGNWKFRNRHRLEYRMFSTDDSQLRYRSDLKVKPSWNWTSVNMNPYVTGEIFVAKEKLTRTRFYGGVEAKKGRFEPAVYGLVQSDKISGSWNNRLIIGIVLGLEL
uniref:DUF2490 domain-containing protein n=1 Tax=uncultured Draconibacterium sp. TaxID=1573823 RepID=UPI00321704AE